MPDFIRRNLLSLGALALLALLAAGSVDTSSNSSKSSFSSTTHLPYTPSYSPTVLSASPTPDLSLLQITKQTWKRGGFDAVALWQITFWNRSDKPIGNIRYRTRYTAETGDQVDRGGVDALLGDYTIRRVIPPHQKRTLEINDGFLHHEAARASFEIVSFEFVNPP
jgi:hypothetical protein